MADTICPVSPAVEPPTSCAPPFVDFFAQRGHTPVRVVEPDPARRHPAVHQRGHGPVQALLRRRRDAAVPPRHVDPEVRARRRQAQRPRRRRPHQPALHVLRDARQLQLRRLLQGRRHQVGVGALHRRPRPRPRAPLGDRPHHRRRSREDLARGGRRARWSGSSAWATTTSGAWPTPARAAPAPRSSGTSAPSTARPPGPAGNEDRYVEIWNLVFMQYDAKPDGELVPLPAPSVDTGAGLERNLAVLQDAASVWDIDVFRPLIAAAEAVTGVTYGTFPGTARDVSLRILAEHGRTMTFLVADGVVPSNEERGYVLRRIIRRAVRHAFLLGAEELVTPALVNATVDVMGARVPRDREAARARARRREPRGGALPPDAGARPRAARRRARAAATSPATTRSSCTTRSASRSTSRARSRRSAAAPSTSTASTRACRSSARAPRRRTRPRAARARARRSSSTASWPTSSAPPTSPAARSTRPSAPRCARSSAAATGSRRRARAPR